MRSLVFAVILALSIAPARSEADVLPPPTRPDWGDPPAPLPDPPEALPMRAFALLAAAAVGAGVWRARRQRASARSAAA